MKEMYVYNFKYAYEGKTDGFTAEYDELLDADELEELINNRLDEIIHEWLIPDLLPAAINFGNYSDLTSLFQKKFEEEALKLSVIVTLTHAKQMNIECETTALHRIEDLLDCSGPY